LSAIFHSYTSVLLDFIASSLHIIAFTCMYHTILSSLSSKRMNGKQNFCHNIKVDESLCMLMYMLIKSVVIKISPSTATIIKYEDIHSWVNVWIEARHIHYSFLWTMQILWSYMMDIYMNYKWKSYFKFANFVHYYYVLNIFCKFYLYIAHFQETESFNFVDKMSKKFSFFEILANQVNNSFLQISHISSYYKIYVLYMRRYLQKFAAHSCYCIYQKKIYIHW